MKRIQLRWPFFEEPLVDKAPVEEDVVDEKLPSKEHISVYEEPLPLCIKSEPVYQEPGITSFD